MKMLSSTPSAGPKRGGSRLLTRPRRPHSVLRCDGILAVCISALALLASAAPQSRPAAPSRPASAKQSSRPIRSDEALQREIERKFSASKIGANHFQVAVRNGIATLTGTAQVAQHKGVATRLARSAGAREVVNRIEISPGAKARMAKNLKSGSGAPESSAAAPNRNSTEAGSESANAPSANPSADSPPDSEANSLQKNDNAPKSPFSGKRFRLLEVPARGQSRSQPRRRY